MQLRNTTNGKSKFEEKQRKKFSLYAQKKGKKIKSCEKRFIPSCLAIHKTWSKKHASCNKCEFLEGKHGSNLS